MKPETIFQGYYLYSEPHKKTSPHWRTRHLRFWWIHNIMFIKEKSITDCGSYNSKKCLPIRLGEPKWMLLNTCSQWMLIILTINYSCSPKSQTTLILLQLEADGFSHNLAWAVTSWLAPKVFPAFLFQYSSTKANL